MATQEPNDVQINIRDESSCEEKGNDSSGNDSTTIPFVPSQLFHLARRTLEINEIPVADYYGEKLAYFFGITSPKYEAEIREYERRMNQRKIEKECEANEYSGWNSSQNMMNQKKIEKECEANECSGWNSSQEMNNSPTGSNASTVTFAPGPDPPPRY